MARRRSDADSAREPWYDISDLMRLFDVGDRTIYRWVAAKKLPEPKRRGRRWSRWLKTEIDEILRKMGFDAEAG